MFDDVYKKLKLDLLQKQQAMEDILAMSNETYEAREQALRATEELLRVSNREKDEFTAEWEHLGAAIEQQRMMRDFVKQSGQKRKNEAEAKPEVGGLSPEEELALKKKSHNLKLTAQQERMKIKEAQHKVHSYEEAFEKLKHSTGISDLQVRTHDSHRSIFRRLSVAGMVYFAHGVLFTRLAAWLAGRDAGDRGHVREDGG